MDHFIEEVVLHEEVIDVQKLMNDIKLLEKIMS